VHNRCIYTLILQCLGNPKSFLFMLPYVTIYNSSLGDEKWFLSKCRKKIFHELKNVVDICLVQGEKIIVCYDVLNFPTSRFLYERRLTNEHLMRSFPHNNSSRLEIGDRCTTPNGFSFVRYEKRALSGDKIWKPLRSARSDRGSYVWQSRRNRWIEESQRQRDLRAHNSKQALAGHDGMINWPGYLERCAREFERS